MGWSCSSTAASRPSEIGGSHEPAKQKMRSVLLRFARREKAARPWAGFPRREVHFGRSGCGGFDSKSVDRLSSFQDLASSRRARLFFSAPLYASLPSSSRKWRFLFLRQSHDRLSRLFRITGLLTVVVALKPGGCSNSRVVVGISFAQFGGTAGEVRAEAARLNDGDLDA